MNDNYRDKWGMGLGLGLGLDSFSLSFSIPKNEDRYAAL